MNSKFFIIFCFFIVMIVSSNSDVFAEHGSSGGGGCSGDCMPPTLGEGNNGRIYVENGITINGHGFDVSYFQQELPLQVLKINETATVSLKIFENAGPSYLTHVFLMFGPEEEIVSGSIVESPDVEIIWEQILDEKPSVTVDDPNNVLSNVTIDSNLSKDVFGNESQISEITFKFTPIQKFDTDVMMMY